MATLRPHRLGISAVLPSTASRRLPLAVISGLDPMGAKIVTPMELSPRNWACIKRRPPSLVMVRLDRTIVLPKLAFTSVPPRMVRSSRTMTTNRRRHASLRTILAPMGLNPVIHRRQMGGSVAGPDVETACQGGELIKVARMEPDPAAGRGTARAGNSCRFTGADGQSSPGPEAQKRRLSDVPRLAYRLLLTSRHQQEPPLCQ